MKSLLEQREDLAWFAEAGEMGERIRRHDWTATPLGPLRSWPASLRNAVNLVLASPLPSALTWGEQRTQLYNDAFVAILGPRHPRALGQDFDDCWRDAFPGTGLPPARVAAAGVDADRRLFLARDRHAHESPLVETFFTHAVTPILGERGETAGQLHQLVDVTTATLAARRLRVLGDLTRAAGGAATLQQCLLDAAGALARSETDLPFLQFYVLDHGTGSASLVAGTRPPPGGPGQPRRQELAATTLSAVWPLGAALAARRPFVVTDVQARFPGLTAGPYPEPITSAVLLPIGEPVVAAKAIVVAGVSQRARLDGPYTTFFDLLAAALGDAAAKATAAESADKLAEANKELEAFSYSVSHDLRTPLRAIDGFSRALLAEEGARLDEQGRRYLERIRAGTQRMAELIDDLLSLSRITRSTLKRERVDLSAIARRVLGDLAARDPERNVEAIVADGLGADADARLVIALFENLLGNAWKFSSKVARARIEVASEVPSGATASAVAFVVRDNGAGFNMDYAKKLFEPFQRLHSASEFQGTGIGLATVHRIVTRHGGRIWAQSAPGQGATFYFTLGEPA